MARRKIAMLLGISCLLITLDGCQGNTNNVEDKVSQEEKKSLPRQTKVYLILIWNLQEMIWM